jgi:pectate lyase
LLISIDIEFVDCYSINPKIKGFICPFISAIGFHKPYKMQNIFHNAHNSIFVSLLLGVSLISCAQVSKSVSDTPVETRPIAFPGAEGFGKYTTGGRGGKVMVVSTLEDDGPGSFRSAAKTNGKRIIVFSVSGTIHLLSPLSIKGEVTIAGQTAPGEGICIADNPVKLDGDQIIVQYLRFRMGDRFQGLEGKVPGSGHDDALGASRKSHIIIDHCSISWSTDEVCSVYGGDSTTLQWNILAEPLNYSYHFEKGDTDWENHGYGGIWGGKHLSAHHNLFAHCVSRNPRFNGTRLGAEEELVDYRNNVIYNWAGNTVYGGEGGRYNMVNNYYKFGPNTNKNVKFRIANPGKTETIPYGKWYVTGNYTYGSEETSKQNTLGVVMGNKGTEEDKANSLITSPHNVVALRTESAEQAFRSVMKSAGASHQRDTLDARIILNVQNGTGRIIDVQGGFEHGTPYTVSNIAWPSLKSAPAAKDSDGDGMPDAWEIDKGLNPNDAQDASKVALHPFFTNIELYIHSIVK